MRIQAFTGMFFFCIRKTVSIACSVTLIISDTNPSIIMVPIMFCWLAKKLWVKCIINITKKHRLQINARRDKNASQLYFI